jgi:tripartite-type tricarboxylate transporter receptor subunit TctC
MVVSYPAGSPSDIPARLLGDQIGRAQGLAVVVENRPGASGTIGTEAVAKAAPDGNTLLFISPAFVIDPHLRKLHYDPFTSFEPICHLMSSPTVIVVNSASPYRTLADLLNDARIKPGVLTLAGVGPASTVHIAFETLKRAAGVNMTFVPYPGPPAAVSALLGGHLTSIFVPYAAVSAQLRAGTLRALATSSRSRIEALPEVPTVAESGFRDYEMDVWFGVVAPAKTPGEVLSQLAAWFASAMQVSEVKAKLVSQGLYPVGTCGADFAAYLRTRYNEYGRVIRESNIRAE